MRPEIILKDGEGRLRIETDQAAFREVINCVLFLGEKRERSSSFWEGRFRFVVCNNLGLERAVRYILRTVQGRAGYSQYSSGVIGTLGI